MDKLEREYIAAMKVAIGELKEVLGADISFDKDEDDKMSKFRKEVNTKLDAFIVARDLIQRAFSLEQDATDDDVGGEKWYRETMVDLIRSAENARINLVKSLKDRIDVGADGDDIQNAIKIKSEAANDIEDLNEGIRDLQEMLKKKQLVIEKKKEFTGNWAEKYAERD